MVPVVRMDHYSHPRITLTWIPEGKRKRPQETWGRTVEREFMEKGLRTWAEAASAAREQGSPEAESLQPDSPLGERTNDDEMKVTNRQLTRKKTKIN